MNAGLYLHVPFCRRKCPYCSFYSVPVSDQLTSCYTDAVCRNLSAYSETISVDSIYFGGGTPSLLHPNQIDRILSAAAKAFPLAADTEITLECNPATVRLEELAMLHRAGVNRLSLGVQSLCDSQLKCLGRLHTAQEAVDTIYAAVHAGFANISCDVMLALPEQTAGELAQMLQRMTALPIQHISAYLLKVENGTPFAAMSVAEQCPDEDMAADLYLQTVDALEQAGFLQYEISNFAKAGYESRHNCKYWQCAPYLGIGPSAHSCWHGGRFYVPSSVTDFLHASVQQTILEDDAPCTKEERIMLGMRLRDGVPLTWLENKLPLLKRLSHAGYLRLSDDRVSFTPKGFLVSNSILAEIL